MTWVPGRFFGVLGIYGSGKTNFLTAIAEHEYTAYNNLVIANFHINLPNVQFMPFKEISKLLSSAKDGKMPSYLVGSTLLMNELSTGADSYEFNTQQPKELSLLIAQIRKAEMICFYDDQREGKIAKRLRDTTDGFCLMEDLDASQHIKPARNRPDTDWHPIINPVGRKCEGLFRRIFTDSTRWPVYEDIWDGKPYRELYNTHEIVAA